MVYITGFMLKYHCSNCKHIAMVEMGHSGINELKKILALGEENRRCPACNADKFRMVQAIVGRTAKPLGETTGVWKCPYHHNERFYPIPLERAFNILKGLDNAMVIEVYKTIARKGLPLRCPECDTPLQYFRGDYYSGYGAGY